MADVQVQQTPDRGSSNWVWALIIVVLIAVIAWFVFARTPATAHETNVDVNVPGNTATPPPANTQAPPPR